MPAVLGTTFPRLHLYATDGVTWLTDFENGADIKWLSRLSQAGAAGCTVPLTDGTSVADRMIVKFSYLDAEREAVVLDLEKCALAVDGERWLSLEDQPTLWVLLDDGTVLPEYGLARTSGPARWYGPMSRTDIGGWYDAADWGTPLTQPYGGTGRHRQYPVDFATFDRDAEWMGRTDPDMDAPDDEVTHAIASFTLTDTIDVTGFAGLDNYGDVWIDGQQIASSRDYSDAFAWRQALPFNIRLSAGTHTVYIRAENSQALPVYVGEPNPCAAIFSMWRVDAHGDKTGSDAILRSNSTDWLVYTGTGEPGWHRGQILLQAITEMQDEDCVGVSLLTPTFTDTLDSNGEPWNDPRTSESFLIGKAKLGEVATALCASGYMDVTVDPDMTVNAYNRKGTDLTASVTLELGPDDGTLISYDTTRSVARATVALLQLADGTWRRVEDTAGVADPGVIYAQIDLGGTTNPATADTLANAQLAESAAPLVSIANAEAATSDGPQLYDDYNIGDTLTTPGHRGVGTIPARVLSVYVDATGDVVKAGPADLVEDRSL